MTPRQRGDRSQLFRNALAINVIFKRQRPTNCESFLHLISIASAAVEARLCDGHSVDAIFRSELKEGRPHAVRYSHPRSPNAERSTPGGAYHPPER